MRRSFNFKSLAWFFGTLSIFAFGLAFAYGQAISGNLTGTVSDPTGAAVNGAQVQATNVDTRQQITTTTKGSGEYLFSNLPVGTYTVSATAPTFQTTTVPNVPVVLNKTGTANLQLQIGKSSTTVEVSGAAPPVDTTTAQLESSYNDRFSQDLGLTSTGGVGAGVLNLSMLSPGVTNASAMGDGVGPSVGGQRPRDNNFTVEGVDNNNKTVTGALIMVPPDAVENFTLLSNQFNSEFGHSSGGQFNTTVKSGTNDFHGSAYEYFRNRNLNAVDQTWVQQGLTSNPRMDNNSYGATFGGPIIKNKLFFFSNFQRNPIGYISVNGGAVQTPTAAGLAAMATDPGLSATNFGIFKQFVPLAASPTGCITYNGTTNGGAETFGNFSAPANGTCPGGQVEVGNAPITPAAWFSFTDYVQSVDYNMSEKDQIRGRYIFNRENLLDNQPQLGTFFSPFTTNFELFNLSEYHTFSPTISNEFRVGFNRFDQTIPAGNFQYPGLDTFPNITLFDLGNGLNVGPDPNAPQFTIQNFYQFVDNISVVRGRHNLKFGGEYRWYISPQGFTQRSRGDYEYNSTQVYLEDLAPDNFGQRSTGSSTYYGNEKAIYWYANDTFRASQHLSVNLGVRYEYTTTPVGENRQILNAISNTPSILVPQAGNQPLVFNKPQAPKNNWAPRIGIAYSPGTSGNTSIRAGFGLAYDTLYDNIGILAVPPQIGSTENVQAGLPAGTCCAPLSPNFLANGGLPPGGGSGITVLDQATALANTANWIPPQIKDPYSVNWNFGIQHSFGRSYTAEINYLGTRGNHLSFQDILNLQSVVTPATALPTYLQAPSQATLDTLPNNLGNLFALQAANIEPANYVNAGFGSAITAFVPDGWSTYHGLETSLARRFSNGLQFLASYTWSHTIDNSTADFHTSDITPRRPEDFFNFNQDKANSALDRAHRFTIAMVYDMPYFKQGNWFLKNIVGHWQFSPVYTFETGEWVTAQANQDSNLNGDSAGDRAIVNPAGIRGTGTTSTPLFSTNSCAGDPTCLANHTVAYLATPLPGGGAAQYVQTGIGALSNLGRNTIQVPGTNNIDLAIYKDLNVTERIRFRFGGQFANIINHPQYIPGSDPGLGLGINDVIGFNSVGTSYKAFVNPANSNFGNPKAVFASNARTIAIVGKIVF